MGSIREKEQRFIDDFNDIGDSFDQYAYLIELSCLLPPLAEELKTDENVVEGCQSTVWLDIHTDGGVFKFASDSNTLIVKGVLYILQEILNGQPAAEVAAAKLTFLRDTAIMDTFESSRQKGLGYVIAKLQETAAAAGRAEMSRNEEVKALILSSKKVSAADMAEIKSAAPLTREHFARKLRDFVLHRYLLSPEDETLPEDFNTLTELSLSQSMKISPELVKEFDLAKSCDGATSAMAKKVLLFMTIQRELGIELPAAETARLKSLPQLADLAWNEMLRAERWAGRLD